MDDLSVVEVRTRILVALFGLTLEIADGGKLKEVSFKARDIHIWLGRRPEFGGFNFRQIREVLEKMRVDEKEIKDVFGNPCGCVPIIDWYQGNRKTYFYKIHATTAENQLSAALILQLDKARTANAPITKKDEDRVVREIYEEFKFNPAYDLSSIRDVKRKVIDAVNSFYFTRSEDNLLRPTQRLRSERTFLELMSKPLPEATREFKGEVKKTEETKKKAKT